MQTKTIATNFPYPCSDEMKNAMEQFPKSLYWTESVFHFIYENIKFAELTMNPKYIHSNNSDPTLRFRAYYTNVMDVMRSLNLIHYMEFPEVKNHYDKILNALRPRIEIDDILDLFEFCRYDLATCTPTRNNIHYVAIMKVLREWKDSANGKPSVIIEKIGPTASGIAYNNFIDFTNATIKHVRNEKLK